MDQTTATILSGAIVVLFQSYIAFRLKQQDNLRDAARVERKAADEKASEERQAIHVMVNSRLSEALDRVQALERKLDLGAGEAIPGPATITTRTEELA